MSDGMAEMQRRANVAMQEGLERSWAREKELATLRAEIERLNSELTDALTDLDSARQDNASLTEGFMTLRATNERLRAALVKIDLLNTPLHGWSMSDLIDQEIVASGIRAALAEEKQGWPEGFFKIERSVMDRCASDGCHQIPSMRLEIDGVGSSYCEPCARKIAALAEEKQG